jgi:hypothetical protein
MSVTPDDPGQVEDRRLPPFCYQTHAALAAIRAAAAFAGAKRTTALAIYVTLTEAANRAGGVRAREEGFAATRPDIAASAGISVDTLDRYVSELVKIGLVGVHRRRVDGVNLPNRWALLEPGPVPPVAAPVRPGGGRAGAAQERKEESYGKKGTTSPPGAAPATAVDSGPPPVALIDRRNLPLDALLEVCGVDPASPRVGQAVAALNGSARGSQVGIRDLFWREACRWAAEHDQEDRLADLREDPERFAVALERAIRRKAQLYRQKLRGATMSPTALRDWWLDLEQSAAGAGSGGLSPDEIANFTERPDES